MRAPLPPSADAPPEPTGRESSDLLAPGLIHEMRHPLLGIKAGLQLIAAQLGTQVCELEEVPVHAHADSACSRIFRHSSASTGLKQAILCPGSISSSGGTDCRDSSTSYRHRGAKGHSCGGRSMSRGLPSIGVSRVFRAASSRGTLCNRPRVYGCSTTAR